MWKSISAILLVSVSMHGQIVSSNQTVTCDPSSHCYTYTTGDVTVTRPTTQTVTQITAFERSLLDETDDMVTDYEHKLTEAQNDLDIIREYRAMVKEDILNENGIIDTTDMTINGLYILYNPYHSNPYTSIPTWFSPAGSTWVTPTVTPPGITY